MLKTGNKFVDDYIEEMKDYTCKLCGTMSKQQTLRDFPLVWRENINKEGYLALKICDKCRERLMKEYCNSVIICAKEIDDERKNK